MSLLHLSLALVFQSGTPPVDFVREIRPLLSDRCFPCHGSGDTADEGGFRLDVREEALSDQAGAVPIVPGNPGASELVARIRHSKTKRRMPPPESKLALTENEMVLFERWIAEGAPYEEHWSFRAPQRASLPAPVFEGWALDPLDHFIAAGLQETGLLPAEEVGRAAWLRRASFDLTGLPPSVEELDAFQANEESEAFLEEVERLLASSRHAERMTTIWLDAARYADTYGYQSDVERQVWPWRDWVIDSFANNMPYDEFITAQLAGDLVPDATRESRLATAFNRLHRQTNEGGSTEEEYRLEYVADRVDTVGSAILGLTMGCARCHDHKFDSISQREYYAFSAFFADIDESGLYSHFTSAVPTPALELPTPEQESSLVLLNLAIEEAARALLELQTKPVGPDSELGAGLQARFSFARLESTEELAAGPPAESPISAALAEGARDQFRNDADPNKPGRIHGEPTLVEGATNMAIQFTGDDPVLFPGIGEFRRSDPFSIGLRVWLPKHYERAVVFHRSKAWTDSGSRGYEMLIEDGRASAALIHFWPGDAVRVRAAESLPVERWVQLTMTWDGSSRAAGLRLYVDGEAAKTVVVRDRLTRSIVGGGIEHFALGERFRDKGFAGGRIDDLFVYSRELTKSDVSLLSSMGADEPILSSVHDGGIVDALARLRDARRARDDGRDSIKQIMTMARMGTPRVTHLLERGDYLSPAEEVQPDVLSSLSPFPEGAARDRLGLARWLTDGSHPLTARVEVNRLWQLAFGQGLVATPDDFGSQGQPPSHPALLDQLAIDFVESGWDRQALLKRLVLSATYRQASIESDAAREIDPDNRLLSHVSRRRLTAEMVRDGALFAGGLLVEKLGGPAVKPYQPAGLWKEKNGSVYKADSGEGLWRRSLYTYWKRTSPPPSMMILDASKRDVCVVKRNSTSSPLQALMLWNDPQYVEAARGIATQALTHADGELETAGRLFRSLTSREASSQELGILLSLLEEQREAFAQEPENATQLLGVGEAPADPSFDPVDLASWTVVAQVVLSFDATLTRP